MFPDYTNGDKLHQDELLISISMESPSLGQITFYYRTGIPNTILLPKQDFREFCEWLLELLLNQKITMAQEAGLALTQAAPDTRYKDMRVTTLRSTGFKAAQIFQPTQNIVQ
jgi:hypothetical protein